MKTNYPKIQTKRYFICQSNALFTPYCVNWFYCFQFIFKMLCITQCCFSYWKRCELVPNKTAHEICRKKSQLNFIHTKERIKLYNNWLFYLAGIYGEVSINSYTCPRLGWRGKSRVIKSHAPWTAANGTAGRTALPCASTAGKNCLFLR